MDDFDATLKSFAILIAVTLAQSCNPKNEGHPRSNLSSSQRFSGGARGDQLSVLQSADQFFVNHSRPINQEIPRTQPQLAFGLIRFVGKQCFQGVACVVMLMLSV